MRNLTDDLSELDETASAIIFKVDMDNTIEFSERIKKLIPELKKNTTMKKNDDYKRILRDAMFPMIINTLQKTFTSYDDKSTVAYDELINVLNVRRDHISDALLSLLFTIISTDHDDLYRNAILEKADNEIYSAFPNYTDEKDVSKILLELYPDDIKKVGSK